MALDNSLNLINQICKASGLEGKDLDALKTRLAKLSEAELQVELTKAIAGDKVTDNMGLVLERNSNPLPSQPMPNTAQTVILKEQQCKEVTCQIIDDNLTEAEEIFRTQNLGDISGAYDNAKNADDKLKTSNVKKVLDYQEAGFVQIIEAKNNKLTRRAYYEENKQRIKDMILTRLNVLKTSTGTSYIDSLRGKYSKEQMADIISKYVETLCSNANIEKLKDLQMQFVSFTQVEETEALSNIVKNAKEINENLHDTTINMLGCEGKPLKIKGPDKGLIPTYWDSAKPISFEEVYKLERGTAYSQYKVEKYVQAKAEMETVVNAYNKKQQFVDFTDGLRDENLTAIEKENKLLAGFAEFYALSEDGGLSQLKKIVDKSKLPVLIENGKLNLNTYPDDASKVRVLNSLLKIASQEKEKEFKAFLGDKTLEEYQQSFEQSANDVLGEENSKLLVDAMVNDNMGMIKRYTGNASMAGMALTVVGGILCFTPAAPLGAAMITVGNTVAIGGMVAKTGLGVADYATKDVKTQDELEGLAKDFVMDAGGFIIGMKAGQAGMKAFSKLIDKKLVAVFGEQIAQGNRTQALKTILSNPEYLKSFTKAASAKISTDFLISYMGDLAMMGVLDTQDDWKSLLQANLTGVLVGMSGDIKDVAGVGKSAVKPQQNNNIFAPKGKISEASKTNPAENATEKVLSEVAKDMTDEGMKLWTPEELDAELNFAEKNPNAPTENLEAISLVVNGKLGKHLTKMYAELGKSFEDVITKHSDEISHLENKYKNNSKKFAQAFTELLAKRLGVSGIAPKVEFAEMEGIDGYFDWPNGKLMVNKELVSNPKAIETIVAHEFVHVIQFKDIIATKGQDGIHEILSSLNNGAYLENVTRGTIEGNGIDYSKLSSEEISNYKVVVANMLAEDIMQANSKLVEFAQNNPIEKGSLKSYLSEVYKNENSHYVNDVNSSEYYNQLIESEAYFLGNGRVGEGIIKSIDLFNVKTKKSQKINSTRSNNINYPKGRIEISEDKRVLEGGIKPEELDEVAPFARHISDEAIDPITVLRDNFDQRINTIDMKPYETTGLPIKYSVHDFAQNLKTLVNDLKIEEQQAILEKFNINLVYTGEGFEISSIPKIPSNKEIKTPLEHKIKEEIELFTQKNKFNIDNPEMKVFLDDFVKVVPEFLFTVGKKQHDTHAYTLDVHILKTLQNVQQHPEYKNLSSEDKMVLNTSLMLHDIGKRYFDAQTPDESHANISYKAAIEILDRFNLPSDTKQRITKLIENHEFYKQYNDSYTRFLNEQSANAERKAAADKHGWDYRPEEGYKLNFERIVKHFSGRFVSLQDAKLAKLFTFADLKSVNPDRIFTQEEWNNRQSQEVEYAGFHKKVTKTQSDAEFLEYIDKSMSYIEKELSQYKDNKIDDELVYPSELKAVGQKIFGNTSFFERIHRNQNGSFGVHRSDLEFCIQARKDLITAGIKPKDVANALSKLLKYDYNHDFDAQATKEFMDVFVANQSFIKSHDLRIDNFRTASALQDEINLIQQKENVANTFTQFGVKDKSMQKRLSDCLYIEEYQKGTSFSHEAYDAMVELFKTNKYTAEEIQNIIHNSFSVKNHRGVFRNASDNDNSYFNKEIYNTILELAKEEPLGNAINDAHLCFESATPESGWVAIPELVEAVQEFNKLGIKDKRFLKTLFDFNYKDGKTIYDNTRVLESVNKNEKYDRALEYAKQGFEGNDLAIIVSACEVSNGKTIYSKEIQDKIAKLVKLGVYRQFDNCDWIQRNLFNKDGNNNLKLNRENYDFFMKMFETGISARQLDNVVYQCASSTFHAEKAAPDKILENGSFSKQQVEAIVKFYKEIGFDKIPYSATVDSYRNLADCFMDVVELTPDESAKMVDVGALGHSYRISKMSSYMAPFRYVNEEKFNQAMDYYKKGVDIDVLKELTQNPTLHEALKLMN